MIIFLSDESCVLNPPNSAAVQEFIICSHCHKYIVPKGAEQDIFREPSFRNECVIEDGRLIKEIVHPIYFVLKHPSLKKDGVASDIVPINHSY